MASRYYFDNTALAATTSVKDSNWTEDKRGTPNQIRTLLPTTTGNNGFSYEAAQAAANGNFTLHAMYRASLAPGLLITGNMRGELVGARTAGATQVSPAISVNIRNSLDVVVATLVQYFPAPFNGYANSLPGTVFPTPPSTAIIDTGYITQVGDLLVVEIGIGWLAVNSNAGPIPGGLIANTDWNAGDSGLAGANPQVRNPWIEFETTLAPVSALDDPLPTFSGTTVANRPTAPSKLGLQFFARDTGIESIWDGTNWKEMVSSISINGGTATGGNLLFNDTNDIDIVQSSSTLTWFAQGLSVDDGVRTRRVTLTNDATEGALFTAFTTSYAAYPLAATPSPWTVAALALRAPGADNALRIGRFGNIAMAGTTLSDTVLCGMTKTNYTTSADALNFSLTCTGGVPRGIFGVMSATAAGGATSGTLAGIAFTLTGGSAANNNFSGTVRGCNFQQNIASQTAGTVVTLVEGYRVGAGPITRSRVTDWIGYRTVTPSGILLGTVDNLAGIVIDPFNLAAPVTSVACWGAKISMAKEPATAITWTVPNVYGIQVVGTAADTGTLTTTNAFGLDISASAVGTNRWSIRTAQKVENTGTDFITSTAGAGYLTKDTQGTPRYWRFYNDATGTGNMVMTVDPNGIATITRAGGATGNVVCNYNDVGTTAPTS